MADARLKIIIEALNKGKGELAALKKDLEGVESSTKKANTSFADVGIALGKLGLLAGGAAVALKKVYDLGSGGAAVEQTRESFDRLGVSIEDLQDASLGTVDDMTLMAGVMTLVAGTSGDLQEHLLAAAPQLLEIAKAANKLNPTLGDTAFMYQSLATGIKRGSKLIIDNTGIVFGAEEAYETYAETIGESADELTETEKKIAFLNATLETGQTIMEQAGGSLEAQTDGYQQLGAQAKNAKDELAELADTVTGPVVGALARGLGVVNDTTDELGVWRVLIPLLVEDYASLIPQMVDAANAAKEQAVQEHAVASGLAAVAQGFRDVGASGPQAKKAIEGFTDAGASLPEVTKQITRDVLTSSEAWDQYSAAIAGAEQASVNYSTEANAARDATIRTTRANLIIAAVNSDLTDGLEDQADKVAELRAEQEAARLEIDKLTASDGRAVVGKEKQTLSTNELALATAQLAVANKKMADADPGSEAYYRAAVQADNLREKIGGASGATVTYIDNTKRLDELRGKWTELGGEIAGTKAEILGVIQMQLFQSTVSKMMVDGINDAELAYLELAGAALGLDTAFLNIERASGSAAQALVDDQLTGAEAQEAARKEFEKTSGVATNLARDVTQIGIGGAEGMNALKEPTQREQLLLREMGVEADVTKGHIVSLADVSVPKMTEIKDMTGAAVARMIDLAIEARNAQGAIDAMHGKDIDINVNYVEHRGVGQPGTSQREGIMDIPGNEYAAGGVSAGGYDLVGEHGPELRYNPPGAHVYSNPVTNNVTNNYNQTVNTRASSATVRQDFALLRAMG